MLNCRARRADTLLSQGTAYADLQNRLFTIFQFIFVAPGVIAQVQPKFIANRDIYETREKKAKLYTWAAVSCSLPSFGAHADYCPTVRLWRDRG